MQIWNESPESYGIKTNEKNTKIIVVGKVRQAVNEQINWRNRPAWFVSVPMFNIEDKES